MKTPLVYLKALFIGKNDLYNVKNPDFNDALDIIKHQ
jgi:hypothetical protein